MVTLDHFGKCMLNSIRNVKFIKMRKLTMFITAVCVLFFYQNILHCLLEAVARAFDEVPNIKCADVREIRLPFNFNL